MGFLCSEFLLFVRFCMQILLNKVILSIKKTFFLIKFAFHRMSYLFYWAHSLKKIIIFKQKLLWDKSMRNFSTYLLRADINLNYDTLVSLSWKIGNWNKVNICFLLSETKFLNNIFLCSNELTATIMAKY